jgi:hypothetical protein
MFESRRLSSFFTDLQNKQRQVPVPVTQVKPVTQFPHEGRSGTMMMRQFFEKSRFESKIAFKVFAFK